MSATSIDLLAKLAAQQVQNAPQAPMPASQNIPIAQPQPIQNAPQAPNPVPTPPSQNTPIAQPQPIKTAPQAPAPPVQQTIPNQNTPAVPQQSYGDMPSRTGYFKYRQEQNQQPIKQPVTQIPFGQQKRNVPFDYFNPPKNNEEFDVTIYDYMKPLYAKYPGGFEQAIDDSQKWQEHALLEGLPVHGRQDLEKYVRIATGNKVPGLESWLRRGQSSLGFSDPNNPSRSGAYQTHDASGNAFIVVNPKLGPNGQDDWWKNMFGHELTHAAQTLPRGGPAGGHEMAHGPNVFRNNLDAFKNNRNAYQFAGVGTSEDNRTQLDYFGTPTEFSAYLSELRRNWIEKNPGKRLSKPSEAEALLEEFVEAPKHIKQHNDLEDKKVLESYIPFHEKYPTSPKNYGDRKSVAELLSKIKYEQWKRQEPNLPLYKPEYKQHAFPYINQLNSDFLPTIMSNPELKKKAILAILSSVVQNNQQQPTKTASISILAKQAVSANPVLARLLEAKAHSDKSRYDLKNQILKELMEEAPEDWIVDDPKPKYKGVTHLPTNFRLHADPRIIDPGVKVQVSIKDLAKQAALKSDVQLQPHQQRIIDRMNAGDNRLLLYHGLGSGKSLSSLAAAEAAGGDYTAVTPASLRQNYEKEIEKFTEGSEPEVMSYTGIGAGKLPKKAPQTVIFDEAHRLRNPNTAGARAARNLTNQAKNLLVLTGTPITNEPSDLASLLGLLHGENITPEQFEKNFVGYKKVYPSLLSRLTGRGAGEEAYVKNEENLRSLLRGKVDYQPSKTPEGVNVNEETVKVPLSSQQERIQNAITSKIPPEWAWKINKEFPLSRDELKSLNSFLTGLRQSSLSTQPFRSDKNPLTAFQQSAKLQKAYADLQEELGSDPRKKAIIYSNYIGAGIDPYAAALESNKVPYGVFHGGIPLKQRKKTLQDYNEGKIRALLLGPAAAEGISTKGTNLIQLLDPHWHESRLNQARGRGLRFDSHTGLPEDLKNVAVKRYISESKDPSLLGWLMGYKRQRTGDEILQNLAANKEKANELFRQILREEGTPKKAGDDSMEKTLQTLLANCIDLSLLFKHCHWNAKGTMFKPLHDFLDEVYERLIKIGDDIAERMVALDYPASGLISQIAASSAMTALPLKFISCPDIVSELTTRLGTLCEMFNKAIKTTESDPVTSNMLQDMTHTLDKSHWMLRRQKENSEGAQKAAAALVLKQLFN